MGIVEALEDQRTEALRAHYCEFAAGKSQAAHHQQGRADDPLPLLRLGVVVEFHDGIVYVGAYHEGHDGDGEI